MKKEYAYGTIILHEGKTVLVQQKKDFFSFPKGHKEQNESNEETAIRETKEETGLVVELIKPIKSYSIKYIKDKKREKTVYFYLAHIVGNDKISFQKEELSDAFYISYQDVRSKLTYQNTKEMWDKAYIDIKELMR